jgi:CspA family cold shock protein
MAVARLIDQYQVSGMSGSDSVSAASIEQPDSFEAGAKVYRVTGFVKWFDGARGYGFIIPDNGAQDVLLHLSCLKRDGFDAPLEGARVTCDAVERQKGMQCLRVIDVDMSTAIHPVERVSRTHVQVVPNSTWTRCRVKWFNRARGFGFVTEGEGAPDIFVHMEILRKTAIAELSPDDWVYVRFGDGPKGKMAAEVRLSLDSGPSHTN